MDVQVDQERGGSERECVRMSLKKASPAPPMHRLSPKTSPCLANSSSWPQAPSLHLSQQWWHLNNKGSCGEGGRGEECSGGNSNHNAQAGGRSNTRECPVDWGSVWAKFGDKKCASLLWVFLAAALSGVAGRDASLPEL